MQKTDLKFKKEKYKQTELGKFPVDWNIEKFEGCIQKKRIRVGKIKQQSYKKMGKFPIVDQGKSKIVGYWNNEEDVYSGELPIIIFGDHTRVVKFIDFKFVCGADGTKVIVPDRNKVDPLYFYYAVFSLDMPSRGYNRHYSLLKEKFMPLPPLPEQQKIAFVLSTVQEDKEKTENTINSYKELKKSLMKHLFKYGPVKFEDTDKVKLKETEIGEIPEGWNQGAIKNYCSILTGGTPKTETKGYWFPKEIPWMKSGEIQGNTIYSISTFISKKGLDNSNARWLPKNSVVIALAGRGKTRGTVALLEFDCTCNQSVICLKPSKKINYTYLHYYLTNLYKYIRSLTGDKDRSGLNKQIIGNIPLFFPNLSIQQQIAEILFSADSKIEQEENKKSALEELFKSMIHNLMTAKIRVKDIEVQK